MTKNEARSSVMGAISMALKDTTLQQGFEIICKNLLELEKENKELKEVHESDKRSLRLIAEKGAELEREISILLSCKNCPENKGGYICQKEYEDKCLAQKIQYIKELKEENAELKEEIKNNEDLATVAYMQGAENQKKKADKQLTKAKEIISEFVEWANWQGSKCPSFKSIQDKA